MQTLRIVGYKKLSIKIIIILILANLDWSSYEAQQTVDLEVDCLK